ncbi:DUF1453 family protein [Actinoplanes regularis]|uniref:DUF1453 domain-containing protein n=1 Tax=Actinoplanes regularis TaxID=52697 RepID=A0A239F039_9ACTN|nr:DUF1453 family protein [Actinoplanes regularis]GIE89894.1 hypothetical protein Are01nite_63740 [Actinoplanes regularis]SNS50071.1 Protein of unknown function [Actinoplanes regularis]
MSDAMREALLVSGGLLAIVLLTQVGKHRFGWIKWGISMAFVGYLYWDTYNRTELSAPNVTAGALGILIGTVIGILLMRVMRVYRQADNQRVYTKAGWAYLGIWLAVLLARTAFLYALENWDAFADRFGHWMIEQRLDSDGIAAFFVLMAMTMVGYRTMVCLIRWRRLEQIPAATVRAGADERGEVTVG